MDPDAAPPASPPRRRVLWRRALAAALLGAAAGLALSFLDPIVEPEPDGGMFSGPIRVRVVDASGDVEQYGPPTVEVSAVGGTVAFEQYATNVAAETGLSWGATEPLVVTFRPWDTDLEPGLRATLDLAPFVAALREAAREAPRGAAPRRPGPLLVDVEVGTVATTVRITVGDEVLLEESVARQDWRSARVATTETCAMEVAELLGPTLASVDEISALVTTWSERSRPYARWITEADRGLRLARVTTAALPTEDPRIKGSRLAGAWVAEMSEVLGELESALLALRSASVAESSGRYLSAFEAINSVSWRLELLRETTEPLVWCAAR